MAEEAVKVIPLGKGKILLIGFDSVEGRYAGFALGRRGEPTLEVFLLSSGGKEEGSKFSKWSKRGFISIKKSNNLFSTFDQVILLEYKRFFNYPQDVLLDTFAFLKDGGMLIVILSSVKTISLHLLERLISGLPQLREAKGLLQKVGFREPFITKTLSTYPGLYLMARRPPEYGDEVLEELFVR